MTFSHFSSDYFCFMSSLAFELTISADCLVKEVFWFKNLISNLSLLFQRLHRRSKDGGAEAGEGRRDQHLLCGFGASVREVPPVSVRDVTGKRKEDLSHQPKSLKTNIPSSYAYKDFFSFSAFVLSAHAFYSSLPLRIMMLSVLKNTKTPVKFWFLKNYLSPTFKVGFLFFCSTLKISRILISLSDGCSFLSVRLWCELQTGVLLKHWNMQQGWDFFFFALPVEENLRMNEATSALFLARSSIYPHSLFSVC